ncbi:helix-turn-helix domain-containing protein [Actinoplanes atraurantiacus]|uniref:Transcriptional regulator, contains XRE-family HTH domain n=1 Tax=Paractinoplanes atraurantiacus TaxID=1036182 RepID=A0A285KF60_9ACTN|nr:helix-turn-helix transcriptional regulator [Actinoplanes atraurantiacus]SNY71245.1 Transcriptional regulator, contains XRE-family HTH domain [Actinoplanes atraurantiacus]
MTIGTAIEARTSVRSTIGASRRRGPEVGARLRRVRHRHGLTLAALAGMTGISKSTLSRLESGQRRPTLDLLLPLAQAHQVPLESLVGAPPVGDPRVRLVPRRANGRTVLPLTPHAGSLQAWKVIVPAEQTELDARVGARWSC